MHDLGTFRARRTRRLAEFCQGALPTGRKPCTAQGTVFCALPHTFLRVGHCHPRAPTHQGRLFSAMSARRLHHHTAAKTERSPHSTSCEQLRCSPSPPSRDTASLLGCTQAAPPARRGCGGDPHGPHRRVPDGQEKKVTVPPFPPDRSLPGARVPTAHPPGPKKPQSPGASGRDAAWSARHDPVFLTVLQLLSFRSSLETSGPIAASGSSTSPSSASSQSVAASGSHELCGSRSATTAPRCHCPPSWVAKLLPIGLDLRTGTTPKSVLLSWAEGASLWSSHSDLLGTGRSGTATDQEPSLDLPGSTPRPGRRQATPRDPTLHRRKLRQPPQPWLVLGDPRLSEGSNMPTDLPPNLG